MAKYVMVFNSSPHPITMSDTGRVIGSGDWDYVDAESDAGKAVLGSPDLIEQNYKDANDYSNERVRQLAKELAELNGDPPETQTNKPGDEDPPADTVSTKSAAKVSKGKG